MAAAAETAENVQETWEVTGDGTVWVWKMNRRTKDYDKVKVGGNQGSRRLRLSADDRRYNEEMIIEEMQPSNPFRNGLLRLVSKDKAEDVDSTYHLTETDLLQILEIREVEPFREAVTDIFSELIVRRLKSVAEVHGTMAQLTVINEVIDERYKAGGTQRTVQEMIDAGEAIGGDRLSG